MKPSFPKFKRVDPRAYLKHFDEPGLDLLTRMITLDPTRRISMREALKHPYFERLNLSGEGNG